MTIWAPEIDLTVDPPYQAIVQALSADIGSGRLAIDQRLPTHRELAETLGLAIGTVTRAYKEAERRGLIRGEVGRGTFVGRADADPVAAPISESAAPSVIDLSCNYPIYSEGPDLGEALGRLATRNHLHEFMRYQPHAGMRRHRAAGAKWAARFGVACDPESVLVCNGAQHGLTIVFCTLAEPGDLILTEALTYPGMKAVARLLHLRLQAVEIDDEGLIPDAFDAACRRQKVTALYLIPTIHNPTTAVLPDSRRRAIAEIARRHDVAIVEDDVHRLLADPAPPPVASYAPERTYFIAGYSKAVAAGIRIGYVAAPPEAIERLVQSIWATCWMVAPLTAEIATLWIEDGTADRIVQRKRAEAEARQQMARNILRNAAYKTQPHAFHIWLELPPKWRSADFTVEARRRGVGITPAEAFSIGDGPAPKAVRVSLGAAESRERLRSGLSTIAAILALSPDACPAVV